MSQIVAKTIEEAFARQGFASTGIVTHWAEIVGPEIADHCEPMRMIWPRAVHEDAAEPATLVLRVEGPVALEIQHLSGVILEKVNRFFGWRAVARLQIRQAPLKRQVKKAALPAPDPAEVARLAADMRDIGDDGLRDALARLGASVKRS
ncbi:MAG: DciA family protein [Alphaproteobacteria bacterium]